MGNEQGSSSKESDEGDPSQQKRTLRSRSSGGSRRVVHLTTVHQPFDPRIFHKQLDSVQKAGFDAHLIAPHTQDECRNGVTIHALSEPSNRVERLALQPKVFRTARFLDADLYQIHDPELIPLAFLLRRSTGAPVVYDMHEDYRAKGRFLGPVLRLLERWCFRWIDHVLLAEKSYRSIVRGQEVPFSYIANYFKPIVEEARTEAQVEEASLAAPFRLLYTGTISNSRGLRTMLDVASEIQQIDRSASLDVVGICRYPDQRRTAERRISKETFNSVFNRVGWDTYVSPSAMPPYYRKCDVGLALFEPHPNFVGALPTKFYEYLYYGLPIICSDFPLWRDFIEEHACGQVVPPGDADAVLDVLDTWQRHPERYRQCAENARQAAPQYRWKQMGKRLVHVYQTLMEDGKSTSRQTAK